MARVARARAAAQQIRFVLRSEPSVEAEERRVVINQVFENRGMKWSWREELNLQPVVYKTTALPLSYASPP